MTDVDPSSRYTGRILGAATALAIAGIVWAYGFDPFIETQHYTATSNAGRREALTISPKSVGKVDRNIKQPQPTPRVLSYTPVDLQEWKSPSFRKAYHKRERYKAAGLYQEFFAQAKCDEITRSKLLDLLVDQTTILPDFQLRKSKEGGALTPEDMNELGTTAKAIVVQMGELVGKEQFDKLLQYQQSIPSRIEVNTYAQMLEPSQALSSAQSEALCYKTNEARIRIDLSPIFDMNNAAPSAVKKCLDEMEAVDREIETAMAGQLNPVQLTALEKLHTSQRNINMIKWELHFERVAKATQR